MVPSWMKKRLAAHSQTDQSCDRPLSVSAGIPFVCRAVGIGTASRKKMTGCRGIIGPIPQPLVIRYSDVGTHSSIKEVFVNRVSEHFPNIFSFSGKRKSLPEKALKQLPPGGSGSVRFQHAPVRAFRMSGSLLQEKLSDHARKPGSRSGPSRFPWVQTISGQMPPPHSSFQHSFFALPSR